MDLWFKPTKSAAYCYYRVAAPDLAPVGANWLVQLATSACGVWRTKIDLSPPKKGAEDRSLPIEAHWEKPANGGSAPKPLAPSFEVCAKCAATLGITPLPLRVHVVSLSLDYTPIEEMTDPPPTPPDPPNELEGVDLSEL
jgi:hypothetical protein